jgi:hypothetical protein
MPAGFGIAVNWPVAMRYTHPVFGPPKQLYQPTTYSPLGLIAVPIMLALTPRPQGGPCMVAATS